MVILPGCVCCGCTSLCGTPITSVSVRFQMTAASGNMLTSLGPFDIHPWNSNFPSGVTYTPSSVWPTTANALDETIAIDMTSASDYTITGSYSANGSFVSVSFQAPTSVSCAAISYSGFVRASPQAWDMQTSSGLVTRELAEAIVISCQPMRFGELVSGARPTLQTSHRWECWFQPQFGSPANASRLTRLSTRRYALPTGCESTPSTSWTVEQSLDTGNGSSITTGSSYTNRVPLQSGYTNTPDMAYLAMSRIINDVSVTVTPS